MTVADVLSGPVAEALRLLPSRMDSSEARVMLLSIGLQESRLHYRRQIGGPARGLWQFELGTKESRGGVWGVYLHAASRYWLQSLCEALGCDFEPRAIYARLEHDDVLAAGVARLLLFTDPQRLPAVDDALGGWDLYMRTWRPGKPHPNTWAAYHRVAREAVNAAVAA